MLLKIFLSSSIAHEIDNQIGNLTFFEHSIIFSTVLSFDVIASKIIRSTPASFKIFKCSLTNLYGELNNFINSFSLLISGDLSTSFNTSAIFPFIFILLPYYNIIEVTDQNDAI